MKQEKIMMGMTIAVEIADLEAKSVVFDEIFSYFEYIDAKFSVFKNNSEISLINRGLVAKNDYSEDMKEVFRLSQETKEKTGGYFNILTPSGKYNPSGLVKGWAIFNASKILDKNGYKNYYIDAGGDIQVRGKNADGKAWKIGIRNPFNPEKEIVKVITLENMGIATSGTYIRGQHIYNPHNPKEELKNVVSLSVIGPNVYEADRIATAAFAMAEKGIDFIEKLKGFEGYAISKNGVATMTSGFNKYCQ